VHSISDKVPVHHLVAVKEVAVQDEAQGGILLVLRVGGFERESCREGLEPSKRG
jgi:hypothetical protein